MSAISYRTPKNGIVFSVPKLDVLLIPTKDGIGLTIDTGKANRLWAAGSDSPPMGQLRDLQLDISAAKTLRHEGHPQDLVSYVGDISWLESYDVEGRRLWRGGVRTGAPALSDAQVAKLEKSVVNADRSERLNQAHERGPALAFINQLVDEASTNNSDEPLGSSNSEVSHGDSAEEGFRRGAEPGSDEHGHDESVPGGGDGRDRDPGRGTDQTGGEEGADRPGSSAAGDRDDDSGDDGY